METLYRKVAVSERKPKESGYYFIINSQRQERHVHFNCEVNEWKGAWETEYWLEEIPNPTAQLKADKAELLEALEKVIYIQDKYFGEQEIHSRLRALCVQIEYLIQKHKQ